MSPYPKPEPPATCPHCTVTNHENGGSQCTHCLNPLYGDTQLDAPWGAGELLREKKKGGKKK